VAVEGSLNLKQIIDFLRLSRPSCEPIVYKEWTKIEGDPEGSESSFRKDNFTCELHWQEVKLYETDAQQFLAFAKHDLNDDSERGRINALSNAKRAAACRVDEILALLNFKGFAAQKSWNVPYKMDVLRSFGVPTTGILKRLIVSPRNVLEHKYIGPKEQESRNAVDLAELFLEATRQDVEKGYLVSATLSYASFFKGFENYGVRDEYELAFDLKNEKLIIKYLEKELWWEPNSDTGEPEMVDCAPLPGGEKEPVTIKFCDCKMEELRELMVLLRERGKVA
jgi:hypothetical protein